MKISQGFFKIIENKKIKENHYRCVILAKEIAQKALPGQFLNIRVKNDFSILLRRPFSICKVEKDRVEILYEVVGPATTFLAERRKGEYLDVVGPLGNSFKISQIKIKDSVFLVAGGVGVAPLYFLAQKINSPKTLFLGAKSKEGLLLVDEFKRLNCQIKIATDDGSKGFKGKVTDLLGEVIKKKDAFSEIKFLYACGPQPMLKALWQKVRDRKIHAYFSLEAHMACGLGACMGCVVETKEGFKRVCKEGPVFKAEELIF